jgi:sec-independent protein translocase protein TatC
LISFNTSLGLTLQPRLSEWVTFAIILPLMFGISFQLPLVMLFLERLQIFDTKVYTQNWRFAVLAISFISMILTPADPISMLLMMAPLIGLYFFGILLCRYSPSNREPVPST